VTDDTQTSASQPTDSSSSVASATSVQERATAVANDRPEAVVGAAFAGGFLLALILKRLAS
jgi:hypothetical protein